MYKSFVLAIKLISIEYDELKQLNKKANKYDSNNTMIQSYISNNNICTILLRKYYFLCD